MDAIATVVIAVFISAIIKWIWDREKVHTTWERIGIKGPKASSIFMGNLLDMMKVGRFRLYEEWAKKYGKVTGYYEGCTPVLLVSDVDIVNEVLVKQFQKFDERRVMFSTKGSIYGNLATFFGSQWKRVRTVTSPTFSAKRMKLMSPLIHRSVDKLINRFETHVDEAAEFDIFQDFKCLTLDVIAGTVFSFETDIFQDKDSIFLQKLNLFFNSISLETMENSKKALLAACMSFPALEKIIQMTRPDLLGPPNEWFLELAKKMIEDRISSGEQRLDYIQLMLEANNKAKDGSLSDTGDSDNEFAPETPQKKDSRYLTMEEMMGQIAIFLAAGYETTATTLGYIAYYLSITPNVQQKLLAEIDEYFPIPGKNINYESVQKLPYLDMVFCEVSRLAYIGSIAVQRICQETTSIKGISIPKGTKVVMNIPVIHSDLDLWGPEPTDEFVPERFAPERKGNRHPMAYLSFGGGPRICVGMRFALMEAKMALINTLQRYEIVKGSKTQVPLKCNPDGLHSPSEGVFVKLLKRQKI